MSLLNFADFRKWSPLFIETGTGRLGGVKAALRGGFNHIKSVEACIPYHCDNFADLVREGWTQPKFKPPHLFFEKDTLKIDLYVGKSHKWLPYMLQEEERAVLWLDAHVSGPQSAGHEDYEHKGQSSEYAQHNVLLKEIALILEHNEKQHVILIDDQNGPSQENQVYKHMILSKYPRYTFYFLDEQREPELIYKQKVLVCEP
jgi:hypothetical protein